jgi:hypothetical protein
MLVSVGSGLVDIHVRLVLAVNEPKATVISAVDAELHKKFCNVNKLALLAIAGLFDVHVATDVTS